MQKIDKNKNQINIIVLFSVITTIIVIILVSINFFNTHKLNKVTTDIYEHPLKVSNEALMVKLNVIKMHRDMKDVVLYLSNQELRNLISKVNNTELLVYASLYVIEKNILGKEGLELHKKTKKLFTAWKPIRDEVIKLVKANEINKAVLITKEKGALHVEKLELSSIELNKYANDKADGFVSQSNKMFDEVEVINKMLIILFIIFMIYFTYYIIKRIKSYINYIQDNEEKLLNTSQRLEYAVNGTGDGLWDWDLVTNEIYFSPIWKSMLGYEDDELKNEFDTWESRVHPDDLKPTVDTIIKNHEKPNIPYETIHRMRHKDGHWVWILDRGQTIFDNNKPIRMLGFHTDITKQREAEEKLLSSQHQFEMFMQNIPAEVFIKDENGRIIYVNYNAKRFFNNKDIIGLQAKDLLSKEENEKVNKIDDYILKNGTIDRVGTFTNHNNETNIYRFMGFLLKEDETIKIAIIMMNITKEHNAQAEVIRLKSALDKSPISVMMTNVHGNIEYINSNYEKVSGYSFNELVGKNPRVLKSGYTSDEAYKKMWEQISSGHIWNSEVKNIAKDGSAFWEDTTIFPSYDDSNNVSGYIAFKLPITQRKKLEKEILLKEEIMIAQSRHAAMGEMISMIAHQWRQPVSTIAMDANNIMADIELDILDKESLKEDSQDILAQTEELSKIIDDFRNFFRPEKLAEKTNIKSIIDDALGVIGSSLKNNSIEVSIDTSEDKEIITFSRELMQVFINIIKNAKDVLIEKETYSKSINISLKFDEYMKIKVCDNAGGIPLDVIENIFGPYFTTKGDKNGTGLGLYMSKTIIDKHLNGSIKAYNLDEGACFEISLPLNLDNNVSVGGDEIDD